MATKKTTGSKKEVSTKYADLAAKAKQSGTTQKLTIAVHKWEEEGDFIIGKLLNVTEHKSDRFSTSCNKYVFDTDNGKIAVICGAQVDAIFNAEDLRGSIVQITYQGKEPIDGGRIVNNFEVVMIDKQVN